MQQRGIIVCSSGGMTPGACAYLISPPPANTSLEALLNVTWHNCSKRACRDNCMYHYARGHWALFLTSVLWPMAVAHCTGQNLPSSESRKIKQTLT